MKKYSLIAVSSGFFGNAPLVEVYICNICVCFKSSVRQIKETSAQCLKDLNIFLKTKAKRNVNINIIPRNIKPCWCMRSDAVNLRSNAGVILMRFVQNDLTL